MILTFSPGPKTTPNVQSSSVDVHDGEGARCAAGHFYELCLRVSSRNVISTDNKAQ